MSLRIVPGECTFCYDRAIPPEVNTFPICGDRDCRLAAELAIPCQSCGGPIDAAADDYHTDREGLLWHIGCHAERTDPTAA